MGNHWDPENRDKFDAFDEKAFAEIKARAVTLAYGHDIHQRGAAIDVLKLCDMIDALTSTNEQSHVKSENTQESIDRITHTVTRFKKPK